MLGNPPPEATEQGYNSLQRAAEVEDSGSKNTVKMEVQIHTIIARQYKGSHRLFEWRTGEWSANSKSGGLGRNRRSVPVEESRRVGLAGHGDSLLLPGWL